MLVPEHLRGCDEPQGSRACLNTRQKQRSRHHNLKLAVTQNVTEIAIDLATINYMLLKATFA